MTAGDARGLVFDIQHFAVHDGPGIRTLVFLAGCPLRCAWCCNPESQVAGYALRHAASRCTQCLSCVDACTASGVAAGEHGPVFRRDRCAVCDDPACARACVAEAIGIQGEWLTAREAFERVAADEAFYRNSGGGVTLSGGEPLLQHRFAHELLTLCREASIHTALETCGHAPQDVLLGVEPLVDLFLFDLKAASASLHTQLVGVGNALILDNFRALARQAPGRVHVRIPVIPGLTDSDDNADALGAIVSGAGLSKVELRPYHGMGADKYAELGREYSLSRLPDFPSAVVVKRFARCLHGHGVASFVGEEEVEGAW